ncbi:ACETYL ESTERASE [Salix koriyanagi]|uniref:ACETYL ESTERASE n=1 Tax=Salix koriyanagi TaxID=2511006 RepID=A0A9Q1A881_9ROSI|nr:ACETYL ESTERASE [Salix koriyanagi]
MAETPTTLRLSLKTRLLLAAHSFGTRAAIRSDHTLNRSVLNIFDPKAAASAKPINGVSSFDISVDPARNLWFRLHAPTSTATTAALPVIIFFHGGGFAFMAANSRSFDVLCRRLARETNAAVISVNYRLAPEHKYPCQYEDGFDTLKYIDDISSESFPASLDLGEERTESEIKLVGAPLISVERTDWMWKAFLPAGSDRNHSVVNVFGPNAVDISGVKFPATLLFVGGFDPLQDWQKRYHEGLKKAGKEVHLVEYPNAFHGFYCFPESPESSLIIGEVKNFVQKQSSLA